MSGWLYVLTRASTMEPLGYLRQAHDRTLSVDLNKSGSAGCWLSIEDKRAGLIYPWSTALVAQHDGVPYWSGLVNSRSTDMQAGRVTISAVGWFERLMHLYLPDQQVQYENVDAGLIAADLINRARVLDPALPITVGTIAGSQPRTITYQRDQSIGQAILDLSELESGFDWYIDPVDRTFNVVPRLGVDRPNCKFRYIGDRKSEGTNLANVVEVVDGSTVVNDMIARGKTSSGYADDVASKAAYGVFQERTSLSDVTDPNILIAYANAEMVYRAEPRVTYTLTPKASPEGNPKNVPRLFRNFDLGDTTYLTVRKGFVKVIDQAERVFGVSLTIADNGTETITNLQTAAS